MSGEGMLSLVENACFGGLHSGLGERHRAAAAEHVRMAGEHARLLSMVAKESPEALRAEWLTTMRALGYHEPIVLSCLWSFDE